MSSENFIFGFLQNLLADALIAIIIGIWIARVLGDRENKAEKEKRAVKIAELLTIELEVNLFHLGANKTPSGRGMSRVVFTEGFKDELWKVYSDGGEIDG